MTFMATVDFTRFSAEAKKARHDRAPNGDASYLKNPLNTSHLRLRALRACQRVMGDGTKHRMTSDQNRVDLRVTSPVPMISIESLVE